MRDTMDFLKRNQSINAYIIRSIANGIPEFNYCESCDGFGNINSIMAKWEDEKIVTIRGQIEQAIEWVGECIGEYNFADIDTALFYEIERKFPLDQYDISKYIVMKNNSCSQNLKSPPDDFKAISASVWAVTKKEFYEKYQKSLEVFQADNQRWFGIERNDSIISILCCAYVTDTSYILSNVFTVPEHRNHGYAQTLIYETMNIFPDSDFTLFVQDSNSAAIYLYEKLGFVMCDELFNLDIKSIIRTE